MTQREALRIVVVGAGGVGGLVGGLLAHAGDEVAFVARGAQLAALQSSGLRVECPRATFSLAKVEAAEDPSKLRPADVVLVAVKAWQVEGLAASLAPLLATGGYVVPLENGVDAVTHLVRALGEERVAGGLCAMLSWLEEPGLIRHTGNTLRVVVGERAGGGSARLKRLLEHMTAAKIDAELAPDIEAAVWHKFMFIAAFSGVAAASRATAEVVREVPETRALLVAAMEEIALLARTRRVRISDRAVQDALAQVDGLPVGATASMQRDIQAGKPSELEDQVGAVVRLGRESGVPTPVHGYLLATLLPQERAARSKG